MLHVVLPESNEHLEPFSHFLREQTEYKFVNLDQWTSFYRFSEEVAFLTVLAKRKRCLSALSSAASGRLCSSLHSHCHLLGQHWMQMI